MDLRQIRYFIATAEELHFGKAAHRVHIAQPALSLQIKSLEAGLGVKLFVRNNRKVELTQAGELLLTEARRIVEQVAHATDLVRRAGAGLVGTLRIGYSANAAYSSIMSTMIRDFRHTYPDVYIQLMDLHPNVQRQKLKTGDIDVAFVTLFIGERDEGLESIKLAEWPLVIAVDTGHRFASEESLSVSDLANEDFVVYSGIDERDGLQIVVQATRLHPTVVHEAPNVIGLVNMVAAGLGIALVPASLQSLHVADSVTYRPLTDITAGVEIHLAYPKTRRSPVVARFLDVAAAKHVV